MRIEFLILMVIGEKRTQFYVVNVLLQFPFLFGKVAQITVIVLILHVECGYSGWDWSCNGIEAVIAYVQTCEFGASSECL